MARFLRWLAYLVAAAAVLSVAVLLWSWTLAPSNDRDWAPDQRLVPTADLEGDVVTLHSLRSNAYRDVDDFDVHYYDTTVRLSELDSLWFVVEPFSKGSPLAHTFLSFGFSKNGQYIAVSVEIRREQGEEFSAVRGLLRQFELMYVMGDERDLIKLRTNYREDPVHLYPMKATPEAMRTLFLDIVQSANALAEEPAFYDTYSRNCTTTIVDHVNAMVPETIPWSYKVLLPGYSDELAYELGLIDTELPFEQARAHFQINEAALQWADSPDFSQRIRAGF